MTATSNGAAPGPAAYSVRDYIRAQVLRRWSLDLATLGDRHMAIALHVRLTKTGAPSKITILDLPRYNKDPVYLDDPSIHMPAPPPDLTAASGPLRRGGRRGGLGGRTRRARRLRPGW